MSSRVALYWPGDARAKPNELALPNVEEATVQLERAFARLGRTTYRVPGFLTKPHEAIERLGPIDDPLVGVCVHWLYGPHTTEGVVGKDNPLLLASNFSGQWPGLVGLLNTGACLESLGRRFSRVWTDRGTFTDDEAFMARLDDWCRTGRIAYAEDDIAYHAPVSPDSAARARRVAKSFRDRRALMLMLGDTSMGMINGYFGPRLLPTAFPSTSWIRLGSSTAAAASRRSASTTRFVSSRTKASPFTGVRRAWKTSRKIRRASSFAITSRCST